MSYPNSAGDDRFGHYDPNAGIPGFGSSQGSSAYGAGSYGSTSNGSQAYDVGSYESQSYDPYGLTQSGAVDAYGRPLYGVPPGPGYGPVQQMPGYPPQPYGPVVGRKEPGLSLLASFFIPGLGTMMNGQVGKGLLILFLYGLFALLTVILVGLPFMVAVWIWGLVDGYQGAVRHNQRLGMY